MSQSFKQVLKYGMVGVIGLSIDWSLFFLFRDVFGVPYWISNIISSTLAIFNNFMLNSYFTFKTTDSLLKRSFSFFGVAGVGLIIGSSMLPWGVKLVNLHLADYINTGIDNQKTIQSLVKLTVTVFVASLQFFANKYVTFKVKNDSDEDDED